jgi:hypothetical protein
MTDNKMQEVGKGLMSIGCMLMLLPIVIMIIVFMIALMAAVLGA